MVRVYQLVFEDLKDLIIVCVCVCGGDFIFLEIIKIVKVEINFQYMIKLF